MHLTMKPAFAEVLSACRLAIGAEARVYLVGGAVRDLMRNAAPADIDLAIEGDVAFAAASVAIALDAHAFPLDESRGQYRVALPDSAIVAYIDIALLADGGIEADLARRDFTIDAMAVEIIVGPDGSAWIGELHDYFGGADDLEAHRVRMLGENALQDDPIRLLRAVRVNTELAFRIEAGTAVAIAENVALLSESAAERQRDELMRILATERSAAAIRLLDALGLLAVLLPELMPAKGVDQPPSHHYYDVFDHSVETVTALDSMLAPAPATEMGRDFRTGLEGFALDEYIDATTGGQQRRVLLKLAALLHDISKPETKAVHTDGSTHFYGHPELGATKTAAICSRLRFGNRESKFVAQLVEEHLRPTQLSNDHEPPSQRAIYRFFRDLDEAAPACLILALADGAAAQGPRLQPERWRRRVEYVAWLLTQAETPIGPTTKKRRIITGDELIAALGIEPGPLVGRLLAAVDEAYGAREIETQDEAIALAKELHRQDGGTD
jgi:poly(A) polymerase